MSNSYKKLEYLKSEIEKIKNGIPSFLGIDGGNIKSKIWFCGIEFGGELNAMEKYYNSVVETYNNSDFEIPYRKKAGDFESSIYDRYLSAMYINLFKEITLKNGDNTDEIVKVLQEELYHQNSKIFKLNLYPLGKKDTGWDKNIETVLQIQKEAYYNDIFKKRKRFLKELVDKFEPKTIICTATNEYKEDFVETFFNDEANIEYSWEYVTTPKLKKFKISTYQNSKTSLIIIPFLGRGNLASYDDVIYMANHLKTHYL